MERIVVLLIKPIFFLTPLPVAVFIALEESVPRRTGLILSGFPETLNKLRVIPVWY